MAHDPKVRTHFRDGILWAPLGRKGDAFTQLRQVGEVSWGSAEELMEKMDTVKARAEAIHQVLSRRRMLLVIDDAWLDKEAPGKIARDLIVGGDHCSYLLTTRYLEVAIDFAGSGTVIVPELSEADGIKWLSQMVPPAVAARYQKKIQRLARAVGGLPLAFVLMRHSLQQSTYQHSDADLLDKTLDQLLEAKTRLNLTRSQGALEAHPSLPDSLPLSIHAMIDLSYQELTNEQRQVLMALSVFPAKPSSFSLEAALEVADTANPTLDALLNVPV